MLSSAAFSLSMWERVFSNESALLIRQPKYWSFSFSISPSNEYSGLISFRIDWFDFLVIQGSLKNLLQHHNLKASVLQHSAFFMIQLSPPYMTSAKTVALTRWAFVSTVMPLFVCVCVCVCVCVYVSVCVCNKVLLKYKGGRESF